MIYVFGCVVCGLGFLWFSSFVLVSPFIADFYHLGTGTVCARRPSGLLLGWGAFSAARIGRACQGFVWHARFPHTATMAVVAVGVFLVVLSCFRVGFNVMFGIEFV